MHRSIPLLALILWACGAPNQVDSAKAQEENPSQATNEQGKTSEQKNRDAARPLGSVSLEGLQMPWEAAELWREVAPENILYMRTAHGMTLIEMAPDFAPNHVQRMRDLASNGYFKGLPFHRVIKDFMAQAGETSLVRRPKPVTAPLQGEFRFRRSPAQKMIVVGEDRNANTGFVGGFAVASQPDMLAMMTADGKVRAWGLHCPGAAAMARTDDPNSANAQFYVTTGDPDWLNGKYTVWGQVRAGYQAVTEIKLGVPAYPPDMVEDLTLGSMRAPEKQARIWVMRTDTPTFSNYLEQQKGDDGKLPDICTISVPVYVQWAN